MLWFDGQTTCMLCDGSGWCGRMRTRLPAATSSASSISERFLSSASSALHLAREEEPHRAAHQRCPLGDEEAKLPGLEWGSPSPSDMEASCRRPAWQRDPSG